MNALIVLAGDKPGCALLESCANDSDLIIAADKGLTAIEQAGFAPDILVGDMDSVPSDALKRYAGEMRKLNCIKDNTDGEDALDLAIERGATHITLLGALGGRMDHALANVMLLVRAKRRGVQAQILSESVRIICVDGCVQMSGAKGDTVSLLPLGKAEGVTLSGFFYPLEGHTLTSDNSLGISNIISDDEASVEVASGDLILFHYYAEKNPDL